jgi:hypothetical protein
VLRHAVWRRPGATDQLEAWLRFAPVVHTHRGTLDRRIEWQVNAATLAAELRTPI